MLDDQQTQEAERPRNGLLKAERQDRVATEVWRRGTASVAELASLLGVSEITIRRDLDELGRAGRLQRVRGGARRLMPREPEPPAVQRQVVQAAEKHAIGATAATLVNDGDVIGIESGSTTLELARALAARTWRRLQVVTNSLTVVDALLRTPGVRLVLVGGSVNLDEMGTFGALTEDMLRRINIDKLFLACRGIDPRAGLTNDTQAEATLSTERALVCAARQVIVLADHTKFGQVFLIQSVPIGKVDTVVTDSSAPEGLVQELQGQDVQVIVAPLTP